MSGLNLILKTLRILILVAGLLFINGCEKSLPKFEQLLVYPEARPLDTFSLISQDESEFTTEHFSGYWNLIFMGYTHCPDVCPLTLTEIAKLYQKLPQDAQSRFQVIFLSVDPERDSPQLLANYINHFNQDFAAITGDKNEIDKLVYSLGGIYSLNNQEDSEFYSVDHSGRIFIVDPDGNRFGIVSGDGMSAANRSTLIEELTTLSEH